MMRPRVRNRRGDLVFRIEIGDILHLQSPEPVGTRNQEPRPKPFLTPLQRIEQRFKIVYKAAFESMAHHLLNIVPAIVSDRALQADFGFKSEHTSRNYVGYLKQAYLLTELHKFSYKSSLRVMGEKLYPIDVALMNNRPEAMAADNLGWRLETVVYLELQRRCRQAGLDIYYFPFLRCEDLAVSAKKLTGIYKRFHYIWFPCRFQ